MRYVLDTTAFSAVMRKDSALLTILMGYQPNDITTVPPVIAEIQYGIRRLGNASKKVLLLKAERDRLLSIVTVLPWLPEASKKFGEIKTDLEHRGMMIDDFDIAIASIAISHKCGVITANLKHFERIRDLEIINWL
jgi:tRNA(fMet)-specific endonuclease VapC